MAVTWKKETGRKSVYYRTQKGRYHGSKLDRNYAIRYMRNGKQIVTVAGWKSDGWQASQVELDAKEFKENAKSGKGPTTYAEREAIQQAEKARETDQNMTVDQFYHQYYVPELPDLAEERLLKDDPDGKRTKETIYSYMMAYRMWIKPIVGNMPIRSLTKAQPVAIRAAMRAGKRLWDKPHEKEENYKRMLRAWNRAEKKAKGKKRQKETQRKVIMVFKDMLNLVMDVNATIHPGEIFVRTSAKKRKKKAPKDQRHRTMTAQEKTDLFAEIIKQEKGKMNTHNICTFLLKVGCRLSDAAFMQIKDVDRINRRVTLDPKIRPRTIKLQKSVWKIIEPLLDRKPTAYVFVRSTDGKPYLNAAGDAAGNLHYFNKAVTALGLNDGWGRLWQVSVHTLRHQAATDLSKKLTPKELQYQIGWDDESMVLRYTHEDEDEVVSKLDDYDEELEQPIRRVK